MTGAEAWSPARVADRLQIEEVLYRYCRAIDRIDLALLSRVFHADAVVDIGNYRGDPGGFIGMVGTRHPSVPRAAHMVTNVLIDFLDADRAFCESWCLAIEEQPSPSGSLDRTFRVRYGDVMERRDGTWRVAQRKTVFDHAAAQAVHPDRASGLHDRIWGARGPSDPIESWRVELGAAG